MNSVVYDKRYWLDIPQNNPDKKALVYKNESISYVELKNAVISLSAELKQLSINKGDFVAIHMPNSIDMVVSILAVLNCGAVVVPINIDIPVKQVARILSESEVKVALHNRNFNHNFGNSTAYCVDYRNLYKENYSESDLFSHTFDDLAYCIFTSGSSGIPKGVLLTYKGILNHIKAKVDLLKLCSESCLCLSFNIGFVASIWQILTPIMLGATLYIYDNDLIKKPYQFFEQLGRDEINVVSMIPQSLYAYISYIGSRHQKLPLPKMKQIILTGEKVDKVVVEKFYENYDHITLINAYGQSECSDDTFHYEIPQNFGDGDIPIGRPIPNIEYLILDENLNEASNGEKGVLYIGGVCLAQSYLNNQQLTNEKFVDISGEFFYRTGDIVKLDQNNDVVCFGRVDNQIKIRGHLVELEEIEAHLNQISAINQAIVIAVETYGIDKILAAYYTSDNAIDAREITKSLTAKLPAYMIPVVFKRIENFFLNPNGKVDRKRVPECVEIKHSESKVEPSDYNEQLDDIQKRAYDIIVSTLSEKFKDNISIETDLIAIGLDSISFIQTVVNLETEFDFEFDDKKLLITEFPTVRSMIEYIESKVNETNPVTS